MFDLSGMTALVTGASGGLGSSIAKALSAQGARTFTTTITADADGFLALEPRLADDSAGPRRLIGLSVTPDRLPAVRVVTPGRDLMVPSGPRSLSVTIEANDDLADLLG